MPIPCQETVVIRFTPLASALIWMGVLAAPTAAPSAAQSGQYAAISAPDSVELVKKAKDIQTRYERYREQRIPPRLGRPQYSV